MSRATGIKFARWSMLLCIGLFPLSTSAGALSDHPSPYLRLHANDAVEWRPWTRDVLQQARADNKLLFISIGYFACHWCHVMRDESFNDATVARVLNEAFIPVKVDRELNPALDDYLMNFVQMTRGHGGWPLNVFVTPEGYPLTGMLYMPRLDFLRVIENLQSDWRDKDDELKTLAHEAFVYSRNMLSGSRPMPSVQQFSDHLLNSVRRQADELSGGIGDQAKFPRPPLLMALLELYERGNNPWLKDFLVLTLDQMASQGLHDVIGGGFFRYTIDPQWHTPHYEKMLYTNAGLTRVYARASKIFHKPRYLALAMDTVEFMLRDMNASRGFVSALSAQDKHGVEGGAYLWRRQDLQQALTVSQWDQVRGAWHFIDVQEGEGVLPAGVAVGPEWRPIRQRLLKKQRVHATPRDEKMLPGWNGYVLSALAAVTELTGRNDFMAAGEQLYSRLRPYMDQGPVRRAAGTERRFFEDYVFLLQGMLDWAAISDRNIQARSEKLVAEALGLFAVEGGWRLSDERILPMPVDVLNIADAQLPSPEIVMLKLIHRLELDGNKTFEPYLQRFLTRVDSRVLDSPLGYASHVAFRATQGPAEKAE